MSGKQIKFISVFILVLFALTFPAVALAASTETVDGTTEATASSDPLVTKTDVDEEGTPLDSLSVSYWPEYDQPSVLVMYRGTVDASVQTPTTLRIAIPKGTDVRLASTSAVDPNNQFQYDAAWNSRQEIDGGDKTILTYNLVHPTFQFEIYLQPVSGKGKRDFDFALPLISKVKNLSVEIRRPVRAENFQATPVAARTSQDGEFEDHSYSFTDIAPGQQYAFKVSYDRADSKPSVDKQTGVVDTSGGSSQTALIIIGIVVGTGLLVAFGVWRMSSAPTTSASRAKPVKSKSGAKSKSGTKSKSAPKGKSGGKGKSGSAKKFCPECGEQVKAGSKFCPECGEDL